MTKLLNIFNNFSFKVVRQLVPSFSGMLRVKAGRPLINWFLKAILLVKGSITDSLVKVSICFVRNLFRLSRKSGLPYTVKYLKACTTLLMQAISGEAHTSTQELGCAVSRTTFGIPRIIPRLHRSHIKQGNLFYIRLWLTFFSLYRVLDYTGKLSVKTIITPSRANLNSLEIREATASFLKSFRIPYLDVSLGALKVDPFWISTTSPNSTRDPVLTDMPKTCSTSIYSILGSYLAIGKDSITRKSLQEFCYAFGIDSPILNAISFSRFAERYLPKSKILREGLTRVLLKYDFSGKLAYKVEPAGKVRVFAMVDCFTQWLMKPLHNALFFRLGLLPRDATHNQSKTLNDFVNLLKAREIKRVYSFDLTAATDRIPLAAQCLILDVLAKRDIGSIWGSALVSRWYMLPKTSWQQGQGTFLDNIGISYEDAKSNPNIQLLKDHKTGKYFIGAVKYAAGQPMGALSSWAMLAMTHHIMVHIAARRVGLSHFDLYLVLGDDLVIADSKVAKAYLSLAKEWDVGINLSKSVISTNGSLEFAKRFIYKYQDVSGLSFKEMAVSRYDLRGLLQLFDRVALFREVRVSELLSFLGHGYKALSRMTTKFHKLGRGLRGALLLMSYPGSRFSTLDNVSQWLLSPSFNKPGIVNMPDKGIEYIKNLCLSVADSISQSNLPRNDEEYDKLVSHLLDVDHKLPVAGNILGETFIMVGAGPQHPVVDIEKSVAWPLFQTLSWVLMPMYYSIIEKWDTTVVEVKDTFEYEEDFDIDSLWSKLEELERIASLSSNNKDHMIIEDVLTINRSSLLRRAYQVRSHIRSLSEKIQV